MLSVDVDRRALRSPLLDRLQEGKVDCHAAYDACESHLAGHAAWGALIGWVSEKLVKHVLPNTNPVAKRFIAFIPVAVAGIGKEELDKHVGTGFSWKEAGMTMAGGAAAIEIEFRW